MKRYIFIFLMIVLLLSVGCKKATVIAPSEQEQPVEAANSSDEDMPQVPDQWKGKTIKEIMNQTQEAANSSEKNLSQENNQSASKDTEAYKVPSGTYMVEARKTETGMVFFPKEIKIKRGETIRWINALDYQNKQAEITIYSYLTGVFRSEKLGFGQYFEYTFNEKGNFTYNALPYQAMFQRGTVVVE